MNSDDDTFWNLAVSKLRRKKGSDPLTADEADAAYDAAPSVPLIAERIEAIVKSATSSQLSVFGTSGGLEISNWIRHFPLKEMRALNFSLPKGLSDAEAVLKFFNVTTPECWRTRWEAVPVAFRQTQVFDARQEAVYAWVREAEIVASGLDLFDFNEVLLRSSLIELRNFTRLKTSQGLDKAQELCARCGVALVLVPELPKTRISGCARWLNDHHALLGLTVRYKTNDQLWFTFFHELAHLLLHRHLKLSVIDNAAEDMADKVIDPEMVKCEEEADKFASETLIPTAALLEFLRRNTFTNDSIHDFAESIGVGPGIVVGRLQRDGVLAWHQGAKLKQKLNLGLKPEV
jgi:HTH-type transcriptional regulator / antitoxin HigA